MANNLAIGMVIGASLASSFKTTFGSAQRAVEKLGATITKSQQQHQKFGGELAKLRDKQAQIYAQMSQASRTGRAGLSRLKREYDNISQKMRAIRQQQGQYTKAIEQSIKAQSRLSHAISLQEKNNAFRERQKANFTSNLMIGSAMAATGVGVMQTYMEQEESANNLKISMMKANGSFGKFNEIGKIADQLGTDLPGTKKDFYNLAQALKKQGVSDDVLVGGALKTSAQLNVLLDMDQQQGGEFLAKFMEGHGLKESELAQSADYLQRAMYAGGLNKDQMYGAMSYYSVNARQLGLTGAENTEKLLAIQAMAGQQGLEGSSFGTNFSTMLDRMNKGPKMLEAASKGMKKEAKAMLDASGVKFDFWDKQGNFKGIDGMIAELEKFEKIKAKFGEEGAGLIAEEIFGTEGRRVAMILSQQGKEGLADMLTKMREQASLQDRINQKTSTLGAALESLGGVWESAVGNFGAIFAQDIKDFANSLQEAIEKYTPFIEQNKTLIKTVVGAVAGFVGVKIALAGVGATVSWLISPVLSLYTGVQKFSALIALFKLGRLSGEMGAFGRILGFMTTLFKGLFVQLRTLAVFFLTNPIGIAITAIAIAAYLIYDNWGKIAPWFSNLWNTISGYFSSFCTWVQGIWNGAVGWVSSAWSGVTDFFSNLWTNITTFFNSGIANISATILNWSPLGLFYQIMQPVLSWFNVDLPNTFSGFGKNLIDGLVNGISNAWNLAKEKVSELGSSVKNWFAEKLGIHSPSRVFKGYGVNVVEGLAIGMDKSLPLAEQSSQALSSAVQFKPVLNTVETLAKPVLNKKQGFFGSLWDDIKFGANFVGNLLGLNEPRLKTPDFNPNARQTSGQNPSIFREYQPLNRNAVTQSASNNVGAMTVNFNPTININGNQEKAGLMGDIQQGLQMSLVEFEQLLNRVLDQRQRRAY